jgi:hypothetical protein
MASHDKAEYQILLDNATNYILAHAASAGLQIQPPRWDGGAEEITTHTHRVRIATNMAEEEVRIPHEWLPLESEGHNRFRTEVEAALARLKTSHRSAGR